MNSRAPNPYRPPQGRARAIRPFKRKRRRPFLWWALLTAPFLFFLLAVAAVRGLEEIGQFVSARARETLIQAAGGWAGGSVRAAFTYPAAWFLERIVHRLRTDSERFAHLALPITVVVIYLCGTVDALVHSGVLFPEHPVVRGTEILSGLGIAAALPLLLFWAAIAFRQRGR
jgi:hypothetical protein